MWEYVVMSIMAIIMVLVTIWLIRKIVSENRKKTNDSHEYVIFCNSSTPKEVITSTDEYLYDEMQHVSEAENNNNLKFALIFSKEFDRKLNEDVYVFKESLELTEYK